MHTITKEFDFCYGHRVWNQTLDPKYSLDTCLACRHLHGHGGKIIISLESNELKDGMVIDFKMTNWFKKFIDDNLDHKFIMDIHDPLLPIIYPIIDKSQITHGEYIDNIFEYNKLGKFLTLWKDVYSNLSTEEIELYEGLVVIDFVPTSENISKWMFDIITDYMSELNVIVKSVKFLETPKTSAEYSI